MILICGASGLVGKEMCTFLENHNIPYIGTYNSNSIKKSNMHKLDFSEPNEIEFFIKNNNITHCLFFIVQRLTDVCENNWDEIKNININMVNNTSFICNKLNVKFIHLSTDYVFDGLKQPNYPEDNKNPLQNYGISKLISEYRVIHNCKNYVIIRTPVLYSVSSKIHNNAVSLIGKNLMNLKQFELKEDDYSIRRPLYIPDLCFFIHECLTRYNGIYHFYNPYHKFTKYEICKHIAILLNINRKIITPTINIEGNAPRPYDTNLIDNKININSYNFTDFNVSLNTIFDKYKFIPIDKINVNDIFLMIDLDGTLVDSEQSHYNSYKKTFNTYNKNMISFEKWRNITDKGNFNDYLKTIFNEQEISIIKEDKIKNLQNEEITYTNNSDIFLKYIIEHNFNFCIVTNTTIETVDIFKTKLPILKHVKNFICINDYTYKKPHPECFQLALNKFYKNEKYIIGIENSNVGFSSLKHITNHIYIYNNLDVFKNNDCYLFDNFNQIMK